MTTTQRNRRLAMGLGLIVALAVVLWLAFGGRRYVSTENAYVKIDMISLTADVSGPLTRVEVERNQAVQQGQVLAEVDPEPYRIALEEARADQQAVRNRILSERADYARLQAQHAQAERDLAYHQRELERYQGLDRVAVSRSQLDGARQKRDQAGAQASVTEQELASLKAKLGGGPDVAVEEHPDYQAATAKLDRARYDLAHTRIVAPADGVIGGSTPLVGERVNAGVPVFTLAKNRSAWVEANLKETQLTNVREGQSVEVEVDSYPGVVWKATVQSLSPATGSEYALIPPQNASGNWVKVVQRVPVKLRLEDLDGKPPLRAGMSAEIAIDTGVSLFGDAGEPARTADAAH
ncbi:HlyD family secretion protein [Alcanivorax marinus]|uniref:HlyD family secretion protein n=1 Tax=Alloalcanivorax marinus TaxID=1177169 RepID=A0A9Q3YPS7_9GAMM|nr:HlyD family secretion protein [Alloalcanivorax marinus]MCC4310231.1 HlyD family secretion protein [Alloalcanivorax marinus]